MSLRSVLIGLLGAVFIAAFGYINDAILYLTPLVGNHFPIGVFGLLIIFAIGINPLLYALRPSWRLRPAELGVITMFMLVACYIPSNGLMRTYHTSLAMPLQYVQQNVGWRQYDVLSYVPPALMPHEPGAEQVEPTPAVSDEFLTGNPEGDLLDPDRVPWACWLPSMATWMPIVALLGIGAICLSLMIHDQWARRERLRYPIAEFAGAVMQQDPDRGTGPLLRNRLFWFGLILVFVIRFSNGMMTWFPEGIGVPLQFRLTPILQKWPVLARAPGAMGSELITIRLYPTVIAFAFFLASDVALSLGLSTVFFVFVTVVLIGAGMRLDYDYFAGGPIPWQLFGSYLGIALLILYVGRRYYAQLFAEAMTFRRQAEVTRSAAWAARGFLLCIAALTALFSALGLVWPFSLLTVLLMMLIFLVISRVNVESGLFFVQSNWMPMAVLLGLFGAVALGPKAMIVAGLLTAVLVVDPRECLMPFVVNGLQISEIGGVRPSRAGWGAVPVFVLTVLIAFPVVLMVNYNSSEPRTTKWSFKEVPKMPFDTAVREMTEMSVAGELEKSEQMTTWQRFTHMRPNPKFLWYAGAGVGLALGFSVLRLRFPWWPLHPVMFLVWGTWPMGKLSHSFFLGWLIKAAITRLGGGVKHGQVKAFMIGVIAGDLLGGVFFMVFGAMYHLITGMRPVKYVIFPG